MRKIVIGIGGSSGAIYAQNLLNKLAKMDQVEAGGVMSRNAIINWELELGPFDPKQLPFKLYDSKDFNAPFASGSAKYETMIVCPCSMGIIGRIASGISNDLVTRAADVILKERRKLILVPRETPYSLIHLDNMRQITLAGGIIAPATPSFYSNPDSIEALVSTVTDRVLDLAGLDVDTYRWGSSQAE